MRVPGEFQRPPYSLAPCPENASRRRPRSMILQRFIAAWQSGNDPVHRLTDELGDTCGAALRSRRRERGMAAERAARGSHPAGGSSGVPVEHALDLPFEAQQAK